MAEMHKIIFLLMESYMRISAEENDTLLNWSGNAC